jgi:MurNAc alpha-1-phosphate uridylyltransferase
MKAMLFAAGLGTRFKPWTDYHPKALAVVNGKSLLQRNIEYLQGFGITEVVVNVHHFADQIIAVIDENSGWGSKIIISDERDEVLETGGGLMKARHLLEETDVFLTMNADILTNLNLSNLVTAHIEKKYLVTLAVMQRDSSRQLLFDTALRLKGWRNRLTGEEKGFFFKEASSRDPLQELAFSGIAVYSPQVFDFISQKGKFSLTEVFLDLSVNDLVTGYNHTGDILMDVGSEEKLLRAASVFST